MKGLNVKAAAIAFGVSWGLGMLVLGWVSMFGWGTELVETMTFLYIGYSPTFLGGIIGALWGFVDGAIWGAIIAFTYNFIVKRLSK